MDNVGKLAKQVQKNYKWIVKNTQLKDLLDGMFSEGIFDQNNKELVQKETTTEDKNRKFLDILLKKEKKEAFDVFLWELYEAKREDVVKQIKETPIDDEAKREDVMKKLKETHKEKVANIWSVTSDGVPPDTKLDDRFMLKVATTFSVANVETVATSLGLSKADVDHAKIMAKQYLPLTQSYNVLVKWRNDNSKSPKLDSLLKGLEDADTKGAAIDQEKLSKYIDELKN